MRLRRRILEWSLWVAITGFLGVVSLEAASVLIPRSDSFLKVGNRLFAILRPGWLDLGSGLDSRFGQPVPLVVNPSRIAFPPVSRSGSVNLPGFSLNFCFFRNSTSAAIWSARISLVVPLVLALFTIAIVYYRLKRLQACEAAEPEPAGGG